MCHNKIDTPIAHYVIACKLNILKIELRPPSLPPFSCYDGGISHNRPYTEIVLKDE